MVLPWKSITKRNRFGSHLGLYGFSHSKHICLECKKYATSCNGVKYIAVGSNRFINVRL